MSQRVLLLLLLLVVDRDRHACVLHAVHSISIISIVAVNIARGPRFQLRHRKLKLRRLGVCLGCLHLYW